MKTNIQWDHLIAEPGQSVSGYVKVGELSNWATVEMPVMIVNGVEEGPVLWLNGAIHGDELNGPMAIREVFPQLDPAKLKGAVIATPVSNPYAWQARRKNTPQDELDMDMQFPGNPKGTLSQRLPYYLFEKIKTYATHLIDFHSLGTPYDALPYTVYKKVPNDQVGASEQGERMARAFGGSVHCCVDLNGNLNELPGNVAGFLDVQCLMHGIPAFMTELGSGGQIQQDMVDYGQRGIWAVLHELGMWTEAPEPPVHTQTKTLTKRKFIYADRGGLVVQQAPSGSIVRKGERICSIIDMFSVVQEVLAEEDTYIIASRKNPPVDAGDRVAFVGVEWREDQ